MVKLLCRNRASCSRDDEHQTAGPDPELLVVLQLLRRDLPIPHERPVGGMQIGDNDLIEDQLCKAVFP